MVIERREHGFASVVQSATLRQVQVVRSTSVCLHLFPLTRSTLLAYFISFRAVHSARAPAVFFIN